MSPVLSFQQSRKFVVVLQSVHSGQWCPSDLCWRRGVRITSISSHQLLSWTDLSVCHLRSLRWWPWHKGVPGAWSDWRWWCTSSWSPILSKAFFVLTNMWDWSQVQENDPISVLRLFDPKSPPARTHTLGELQISFVSKSWMHVKLNHTYLGPQM